MFSSIGLPGLNGFVGEFLILVGSFTTRRWWAVVAAVGVILAALYLLWAYQRVFHGTPDEDNADAARAQAERRARAGAVARAHRVPRASTPSRCSTASSPAVRPPRGPRRAQLRLPRARGRSAPRCGHRGAIPAPRTAGGRQVNLAARGGSAAQSTTLQIAARSTGRRSSPLLILVGGAIVLLRAARCCRGDFAELATPPIAVARGAGRGGCRRRPAVARGPRPTVRSSTSPAPRRRRLLVVRHRA